ncbi:MAG: DUF1569 domain-containing protein [Ferruginibacter sp.]
MENLFDAQTYITIIARINTLKAESAPQWGKMNVAQMMCHTTKAFKVPLSDKRLPRLLIGRIFGSLIKHKLYNDVPWKKSIPTSPNLIVKDEREFENEKAELLVHVNKFYAAGPTGISKFPHPMFGKFTPEQWGKNMYKHIDHHLTQFGV